MSAPIPRLLPRISPTITPTTASASAVRSPPTSVKSIAGTMTRPNTVSELAHGQQHVGGQVGIRAQEQEVSQRGKDGRGRDRQERVRRAADGLPEAEED